MASVKVHHSVKVGGKTFKLRTRTPFMPQLAASMIRGTIPQMRNMAQETRDIMIDKALAGVTQGRPKALSRGDFARSKGRGKRMDRRPFPFNRDRNLRLEPGYVDFKVRHGKDPRPLLSSGDYFDAIFVFESKTQNGITFEVRLRRGRSKETGVPFDVLWRWLEYGNSVTKPRPHWRPTARIVKREIKRIPEDARAQAVRETLRRIK